MVSSVTIQGSSSHVVTLSFDTATNFLLAEQIAARITAGVNGGSIVTASDINGPPPALPDGVSGVYMQTQAGVLAMPAGYTTDIVTKANSAIVFGSGAAGETIVSDLNTSLTFIAASGSGTVLSGGGNDRLMVSGLGDWSLHTGNGNDVVAALGRVNATIGAGGGHNGIALGAGNDLVVSLGDDSVSGGSGAETIDATGAHSDFVQGNASRLLFVGGLGGATIMGGSGSDTYLGSSFGLVGKQVVIGGTAGHNFLFAGDGAATLAGGGNGDQLFAFGSSGQLLKAGAGNETLSAALSSGNDTLAAGSGKSQLISGSGADTFIGGSGQATITTGFGGQVFEFINHAGGGSELVQGLFDPSMVKIDLEGYGNKAIDHALATQTTHNGSVTIGLADGSKITFQDIAALSRSNFI